MLACSQVPAPAQKNLAGAVQTKLALERLKVLGSVLLIGAHPDDENAALLAYLARGRKARAAYLSLTRGDGGQNLIGSEQGELLGLIRTQELLAARRIDGAEQYFTRAIDFGFSKTAEETFEQVGPRGDSRRRGVDHPALPPRRDRDRHQRRATGITRRPESWRGRRSPPRPTRPAFPSS